MNHEMELNIKERNMPSFQGDDRAIVTVRFSPAEMGQKEKTERETIKAKY